VGRDAARPYRLREKRPLPFPSNAFNSQVVMAADSMLRRAKWAQAGSRRLHDQADYGDSASLTFEASSFKGNQTSVSPKGDVFRRSEG